MSAEGFFHRWSRLKGEAGTGTDTDTPAAATPVGPRELAPATDPDSEAQARLPTLQDVDSLDAGSDYSPFVAQGVDKAVHRQALKKLFLDPHFNLKDGLDIYMDDYNKPDPVSAAMLGALQHAQSFFAQAAALEPPPEEGAGAPQMSRVETANPQVSDAAGEGTV